MQTMKAGDTIDINLPWSPAFFNRYLYVGNDDIENARKMPNIFE